MNADCPVITLYSESPRATHKLGTHIGTLARAGDILCLHGDLGAGKTTFVQGIAEGLGIEPNQVNSPTFSLLAEHISGRIPLYHLDVYRLSGADQLYDLGFDDYLMRDDGLIVIEWAELVAEALPSERVEITLEPTGGGDNSRALSFAGNMDMVHRLVGALC